MCPADTSPEAWKVFLEIQRRMTPGEKFQRALEWSEVIRRFVEADLRGRHPEADDHEILLRYARRTLGQELFRSAYGDALPDDEPAGRNA
jgi:exoribonuclease R